MSKHAVSFLLAAALGFAACPAVEPGAVDPSFSKMPPGWVVKKSRLVPQSQQEVIAKKLQAQFDKLSNTVLIVHGKPIQVNLLDCPTESDARRLHKTILKMKKHMCI